MYVKGVKTTIAGPGLVVATLALAFDHILQQTKQTKAWWKIDPQKGSGRGIHRCDQGSKGQIVSHARFEQKAPVQKGEISPERFGENTHKNNCFEI